MTSFREEAVRSRPDAPALTDGRRTWSWRELDSAARLRAGGLAARGAGPGRTVALVLGPSAGTVIALHAVLDTGALLAPLHPGLTEGEIAAALDTLRPELAVVETSTRGLVRRALDRSAAETPVVGVAALEDAGGSEAPPVLRDPRGAVAVLWTSGTAGRPRGVLLTAEGLGHSAVASRERLALEAGDRWYVSLSPAHVGGLALVLRAAVIGSALLAPGPFRVEELSRAVDDGAVTHVSLVPTMLRRLLDLRGDRPPPGSLRCLLVGGAACPRPLLDRALAAGLPVALTYGLTEATSQVATAPPGLVRRKPESVGPPLDGVEVRIGEGDEILVRGPTVTPGLVGAAGAPVDEAGWLRTGDLGALDDEGHLRVTGRRSDRIVTGGVNVDPGEVEGVLLGHPGVAEAAVLGVPDPEWGERVEAALLPAAGSAPDPGALRDWLRERLSGPKTPKRLHVVAELPRNANGKVDRAALRRALESRDDASARDPGTT